MRGKRKHRQIFAQPSIRAPVTNLRRYGRCLLVILLRPPHLLQEVLVALQPGKDGHPRRGGRLVVEAVRRARLLRVEEKRLAQRLIVQLVRRDVSRVAVPLGSAAMVPVQPPTSVSLAY